ncbi:hypothetical protein TRFO_29099 [Tritrichomonas foetus]|uniref:Cleavage stimulation factor subunit 2 hinge domain-containing protein n=1 Tax=Tritrichomonas foetus TaxID=1144522 RepID=A0A1J4K1Z5_9EUKA|nr:hypothetical protein TRFO_29099 [Tritrichomonas foetus]|eukprot:OHT03501.1 hypothetical protein TRFO_29099 [Tritrichomonas foetus]
MDIQRLTKILSEAKNWIQQNRDQARDQLLDSPQLSYALYHIPEILEQKYQDIETGILDQNGNPRNPSQQIGQFNQQAYRMPQMQGVFLDFQNTNDDQTSANSNNQNNDNQQQIPPQSTQNMIPPPPPIIPPVQNYYNQYPYPPNYGGAMPPPPGAPAMMYGQQQQPPQMAYEYQEPSQLEEEFRQLALQITPEQLQFLDEETKMQVLKIRSEYEQMQMM